MLSNVEHSCEDFVRFLPSVCVRVCEHHLKGKEGGLLDVMRTGFDLR